MAVGVVVGGAVAAVGLTVAAAVLSGAALAAATPFWLIPAAVGVFALLAVWGVLATAPPRRRVLGGLALAAGAAMLLTRVWRFVDPYAVPGAYTTTRPLVLAAVAVLTALGLLVVLLPVRAAEGAPRRRRAALSGAVTAVAVLLVAAVGATTVVTVAQQRNVEAAAPAGPPGTAPAPVLDGGLAWQATGGDSDRFAVTDGGVAQYLRDGVRMLDPATGQQRWSYRRRDVLAAGVANRQTVVSDTYTHLLAATAVLDAVDGTALASIPEAADDSVDDYSDWLVDDTVLDVDSNGGGDLTAFTLTGQRRWVRPYNGCIYLDAQPAPRDGVVVDQFCGDDVSAYWATLLDQRTGTVRWTQKVGAMYQFLPRDRDTIVLAKEEGPTLVVTRLEPANGKPLWTTRIPAAPESAQFNYGYRALHLAHGELLVANPNGPAGALVGLNPNTGAVDWTDQNLLALTRPDGKNAAAVAATADLPNGRTALVSTGPGNGLVLRQLDPHTGVTTAPRPVALPPGATAVPREVTLTVSHGALLLTGIRTADPTRQLRTVCRLR